MNIRVQPSNNIAQSIQDAYNKAITGDTLILPSGEFPYVGSPIFKMGVKIKGAGKGKTILFRPETTPDSELNGKPFFTFDINKKVNCGIVVSGTTFRSKIPEYLPGTTGSQAIDYGIKMNCAKNFKIFNCSFENFGYAGISVNHYDDSIGGLIYNNDFINCAKGKDGLELGYGIAVYGSDTWKKNADFGTSKFIFIEENYFEGCRHVIAGGGSGCYVARFNKIKNCFFGHAIDMHEARNTPNNVYSTRACEIYGNEIINTVFVDGHEVYNYAPYYHFDGYKVNGGWVLSRLAIGIRGGESLIYDNTIAYFRRGIKIYKSNPAIDNMLKTYIWDNKLDSYGPEEKPYNLLFENGAPETLKENFNYFLCKKECYQSYKYPHHLRN